MSDLISRSELIKFFKEHMRTAKDFREIIINIIPTIKNQPTAYDVDKVIEELELHSFEFGTDTLPAHYVRLNDAIEIVKQGGDETEIETIRDKAVKWNNNSSKRVPYEFIDYVEGKRGINISDDVCEWKLCDGEANVYNTSCGNPHILIEGTPKENNYEYCPYCGKKIKVVMKNMAKMNLDECGNLEEPCLSCDKAYMDILSYEWCCDEKECQYMAENEVSE